MAGNVYNMESLELSKKATPGLERVIEVVKKGTDALSDITKEVGSDALTKMMEETLAPASAELTKVTEEFLAVENEYQKAFGNIATALN